ncbi:MAG TPA: polysaccharide deacetylase family protein [Candidatus Brocadiaceae bacterium]
MNDNYLYVAMSLDIDPDANVAVEGRYDALSAPLQSGNVRVEACKKGLHKILELLDVYDINATLFYEARTAQMLIADRMDLPELSQNHEIACHSLKHEDYLGKVSGLPMKEDAIQESIAGAREILEGIFGRTVRGFRAPYTRVNQTVIKVLERMDFHYDSSETINLGTTWNGKPFPLKTFDSTIIELPLPAFPDARGKKMTSYLWAIFEGKRNAQEYIDAVVRAKEIAQGGLFVFAIHPWHLWINSQGDIFADEQVARNLKNFESIISQLKRMKGIRIIRMDKYLGKWR